MTVQITNDGVDVEAKSFKDGGSQLSFICEELAEVLNIPLTVNGFNTSRKMITKLVKADIKIGKTTYSHNLI